jgi:hypothetical protein
MELFNKEDIDLVNDKIEYIIEQVEDIKLTLFEPTMKEMSEVFDIITNYIKQYKRKIYGGIAMNTLIIQKNKEDAIYKNYKIQDIEFYSYEPIQDIIRLCNILQDAKYKYVLGTEAMHRETYSIFVNHHKYCDITYMPRNIYNKAPFEEINGLYYISSLFMTIDYLRMLTDPLLSYFRIEKSFNRLNKLLKHYPLPEIKKEINLEKNTDEHQEVIDYITNYCYDNQDIIIIGIKAYNIFLQNSGMSEDYLPEKYHELISSNYSIDAANLITKLKQKFQEDITYVEYYPFFQFMGNHTKIYYKNKLVSIISSHNRICRPYKTIIQDNKTLHIGSFTLTILFYLIMMMKSRIEEDKFSKNMYITMISHLLQFRSYYLKKNKKTILDDTLFSEFVINCKGPTIPVETERRLLIEQRKKEGKPYVYRYEPDYNKLNPEDNTYKFNNSSGNKINNMKNLKLNFHSGNIKEDIIKDISEEKEEQEDS